MALIPFLLEYLDQPRPSRLLDQHFGHGLSHEDMSSPLTLPRDRALLSLLQPTPGRYYRPWRSTTAAQDTGSTVSINKNQFQVNLDVQQFKPEEITVKVTDDNWITVEGKHEEKEDEHGFIFRHFVRRYFIPKGHDMDKIESKLSSDGVLTIIAPKAEQQSNEHRHIQITQTGQPSRPVENKTQENGDEKQANAE